VHLFTPTLGGADRTRSTFGFWYIQRYWKISTKKMFVVTNVVTVLIPLWGADTVPPRVVPHPELDSRVQA
jgi:hypothetical protein